MNPAGFFCRSVSILLDVRNRNLWEKLTANV